MASHPNPLLISQHVRRRGDFNREVLASLSPSLFFLSIRDRLLMKIRVFFVDPGESWEVLLQQTMLAGVGRFQFDSESGNSGSARVKPATQLVRCEILEFSNQPVKFMN